MIASGPLDHTPPPAVSIAVDCWTVSPLRYRVEPVVLPEPLKRSLIPPPYLALPYSTVRFSILVVPEVASLTNTWSVSPFPDTINPGAPEPSIVLLGEVMSSAPCESVIVSPARLLENVIVSSPPSRLSAV